MSELAKVLQVWEDYKEKNPPKGGAAYYYRDNRDYFVAGYEVQSEQLAAERDTVRTLTEALESSHKFIQEMADAWFEFGPKTGICFFCDCNCGKGPHDDGCSLVEAKKIARENRKVLAGADNA